ncbi:hypothetical protein EPN44_10900 [bacterium]|nr:MAG: hypothetical protein EPN44_10900 [bacterium]
MNRFEQRLRARMTNQDFAEGYHEAQGELSQEGAMQTRAATLEINVVFINVSDRLPLVVDSTSSGTLGALNTYNYAVVPIPTETLFNPTGQYA